MPDLRDIRSAVSTITKMAEDLERLKRRVESDHVYYAVSTLERSTEAERLVLLGAYLATRQILLGTGQKDSIRRVKCRIDAAVADSANLALHFGSKDEISVEESVPEVLL